jgi:cytochrome c oxidase subunit 4
VNDQPVSPRKRYVFVWLVSLVLLLLNLGAAFLPLGRANGVLNLAIAMLMAALVMTFSMHLRDSGVLIRITAAAGFIFLAILIGLSLTDFLTRASLLAD